MIVAWLEVELGLEGCFSLKEKRRILQSILHKLRNDLQVSASEVGDQELWNRAMLGVALTSSHAQLAESVLDKVLDRIDAEPEAEVLSAVRDVFQTHDC